MAQRVFVVGVGMTKFEKPGGRAGDYPGMGRELTWQPRGEADDRQVTGACSALQHNLGLGGAAVVTVYTRGTT